jgi:UDP-N-acetylmuramate dehydrogenase
MPVPRNIVEKLASIADVTVSEGPLLGHSTRFGIGGPAEVYLETGSESGLAEALEVVRESGVAYTVIGDGTNLIVSDAGFAGVVLRFTAAEITSDGKTVKAAAGAELQGLVDYCIDRGLLGLETMTGIPGSVGAAVYGNAGAYGHSINERIRQVRAVVGGKIRVFQNTACEFRYRESIFKRHKDWVVVSVELLTDYAPSEALRKTAGDILKIRLEKYPPSMKCAGSIFKNLIFAELSESVRSQVPGQVIREGKVPSAYFLEQVGAKGLQNGGIRVADYHANLIYNAGQGTAAELCQVIEELKSRVQRRFGLTLEEEVQYIGFSANGCVRTG